MEAEKPLDGLLLETESFGGGEIVGRASFGDGVFWKRRNRWTGFFWRRSPARVADQLTKEEAVRRRWEQQHGADARPDAPGAFHPWRQNLEKGYRTYIALGLRALVQ